MTRCWLMLDQMWDYRTNTYRFDYEINRDYYEGDTRKKRYGIQGKATGVHYYQYIDMVSQNSGAVLLNIRRYEPEVLDRLITMEKWKEVFKAAVHHYKKRCPNLRYIEVLNEPTAKNQSNIGSMGNYYRFYCTAYEAVNELNDEMKPQTPLLVGGPSGFGTKEAVHLIRDFAKDRSPDKRLDFVSFHDYWTSREPQAVAGWEAEIDRELAKHDLTTDLPVFVTEIGYVLKWKDQPGKNLLQAAGMTAFQYFARDCPDLRLFPWVQYHSRKQIGFVQFDTDMRMTPYGAAVKMLRMHRAKEVASTSEGLLASGLGVGSLATMDDHGLSIQIWNLRLEKADPVRVRVAVKNVPERLRATPLRVRRYQIDTSHSNIFTNAVHAGGLEMVEELTVAAGQFRALEARLEPNALCLWSIVPNPERNEPE